MGKRKPTPPPEPKFSADRLGFHKLIAIMRGQADGEPRTRSFIWIVNQARAGSREADVVLRLYAIEALDRGDILPTVVAAYIQNVLWPWPLQTASADDTGKAIR